MKHFNFREATINDTSALAALHVTTFNETHGLHPNSPTYELRKTQWQKAFEDKNTVWFCIVIENEEGDLIGFSKGQQYTDVEHGEFTGELNKLYILRRYHKIGLGRKLLCISANEFLRRGISCMLLFGDAHNPSNGFYERMGGKKLYAGNGEFHGGYGWPDLSIFASNYCTNIYS